MAVMPVRRLLLNMAWPMMLSMLIQALYNLVDSMFVAQLSSDGFVALALVYPIQTLMIAVCVGTGVGFNALLARRLGEGRGSGLRARPGPAAAPGAGQDAGRGHPLPPRG